MVDFLVSTGEVKIGWIHNDELVQKQLKMGDVLHIEAGATFYMVNTGKGQRLQIICSIDASDSPIGLGPYQVTCPVCSTYRLIYPKSFTPISISILYILTN